MSDDERWVEAERWLCYAQEDLNTAEILQRDHATPRHICWLAQQAAEKSLKAVLVFLQIDFPRRHDLDALRNLIPDDWGVKENNPDLAELTEWAVEARYPGNWPEATGNDAESALTQACKVYQNVMDDFKHKGHDYYQEKRNP